ncbi:MAG: bifunctional diaminohydroxyphosphoribosylaminopyrimidine deaminase/5-amino-6-(5-phosphoribosylamino)uracil reductase RibD, partial [Stenotrophobium sp.]
MTNPSAAGWMARAMQLAERGRCTTQPNPRVGCVIVQSGEIVGEGFHERAGEPHAEVHALRIAGERARGAEVFVTLEPCNHTGRTPPCVDALIAAGVRKVVAAMQDPNPQVAGQGIARLKTAGIEVECGLMQKQAESLNRGFVSRMTRGRPFVTLKLAASLDGRTAMASGESKWITSEEARVDVHRLRAEAGAVLTSSATVLADDPELTVRLSSFDKAQDRSSALRQGSGQVSRLPLRQPDRIVLDAQARVPAAAKVWNAGARRIQLVSKKGLSAASSMNSEVEVMAVEVSADGRISIPAALKILGEQQVNEVLVECGPTLAGSFLQSGLVDELVLYLSPCLLGDAARPLARLPGLEQLDQRVQLRWLETRMIGPDLR